MRYSITIFIFLLIFSGATSASPVVNIKTSYYSVSGSTANELRKSLNANSPVRQSGKRYDAYTAWMVHWHFNWNKRQGQCYITHASSTVDVRFTMPRWTNRNQANGKLKSKWDKYYTALTAHENGHKRFGINAAREIERRIQKMPPSATCTLLEQKANALGKKVLEKYIYREKAYDKTTRHGMANGASFP